MDFWNSPFSVPLGAFLVAIVAIVVAGVNKAHAARLRAEQRDRLLARGIPLQEVERVLSTNTGAEQTEAQSRWNPGRSTATARRTSVILISTGIGLILFFVALAIIERERDCYSGAAIGLVPICIGIGFFVDYRAQVRDMARLRESGEL